MAKGAWTKTVKSARTKTSACARMRTTTTFWTLILIAVVLIGAAYLTGCPTPKKPTPPPANGNQTTAKPPETTKPTLPDRIIIGCITPLTGKGATYGQATQRGITLALDKLNAAGGIDGHPVDVVYEDSRLDAKTATDVIHKLISINKVPVILGAFGSDETKAIASIAEQKRVVLFSASSTADDIKDKGDYVFRNVPPNNAQGKTAADFVLKHLNVKTACVLYINNDYGTSLKDSFEEHFKAGGGSIASSEAYNEGASDFRSQLSKIKQLDPPVVFYPGHYQESGQILKQARELGIKAVFIGGDGSYSPDLIKIAGNAAEGSYYTLMAMDSASSSAAIIAYQAAYKAKFAEPGDNVYSAYAYDALLTIAEAIRLGGYTGDGIKTQLYSLQYSGITGVTKFDSNGEVDKPFGVFEVKNGEFVQLTL